MLIHRDALVVTEAATAEDTRYFRNGAFIDKDGRTVATDGHMLARFTSTPIDAAEFPAVDGLDVTVAEDTIVSRDDVCAALATMKGRVKHTPQYLAIVPNGKTVTIATAKSDRTVQITARKLDGQFPAYERVLQAKKPIIATVTINTGMLETLGRMVKAAGGKAIVFTIQGDSNTITDQLFYTAECEHGTLDGAIMPMRS